MTVLIADQSIPYLDYFFSDLTEVRTYPGEEITQNELVGADYLLVRSKTRVDGQLLQNSSLKFVGSCVAGTDHIAIEDLATLHIPHLFALGCNRWAVVEYVLGVLAVLQLQHNWRIQHQQVAVIGVGRIGSRVAELFEKLGAKVLLCDPFKASEIDHIPLEQIKDCALIACHTPLTYEGAYPTYHMLDAAFFHAQAPHCVFLNAGRGRVASQEVLIKVAKTMHLCLDVWPDEPQLDPMLVKACTIATPHIAGHSVEGKLKGTEMVYQAMAHCFAWPKRTLPQSAFPWYKVNLANEDWAEKLEKFFGLRALTDKLQSGENSAEAFQAFRQEYMPRPSLDGIFKEHKHE